MNSVILNFSLNISLQYNDDTHNENNFIYDNTKVPIPLNNCDISTLDVFNAPSDFKSNLRSRPDRITVKL